MKLADQVVVITGAGRGLGKALAVACSQRGATVVMSDNDESSLAAATEEVGGVSIVCDVTNEAQVEALVQEAVKRCGQLDIMVNNAGIFIPGPVERFDSKTAQAMMEVNFFGTAYGSKHAYRQMIKQGCGAIVNIISTSALSGRPDHAAYAATKFAADGFTKSLALSAEPYGIKVLAVYPGGMKTGIFGAAKPTNYDQFMDPVLVAEQVLARLASDRPGGELIIRRPNA